MRLKNRILMQSSTRNVISIISKRVFDEKDTAEIGGNVHLSAPIKNYCNYNNYFIILISEFIILRWRHGVVYIYAYISIPPGILCIICHLQIKLQNSECQRILYQYYTDVFQHRISAVNVIKL